MRVLARLLTADGATVEAPAVIGADGGNVSEIRFAAFPRRVMVTHVSLRTDDGWEVVAPIAEPLTLTPDDTPCIQAGLLHFSEN